MGSDRKLSRVVVYPAGTADEHTSAGEDRDAPGIEFSGEVDFISFINADTHGPPPLIAPKPSRDGASAPPLAAVGDTVLYINPDKIVAVEVTK